MTGPINPTAKPVQLQVNLAGAWKTVLYFDAGDDTAAETVQQGTTMLHEASPTASWRIATREPLPQVLRYMGMNTYGIWMDKTHEF